jgi:fructokinase
MVISLGEALIDFVSQKSLSFDGFPGGSPYNTAIAVSRLGTECQFLGRVSKDLFGEQLLNYLKENSVGTDLIVRTADKTTLSFVQKQEDGQAQYAFFANDTADRNWTDQDLKNVAVPEEARIIHFGSISISQDPGGAQLTSFLKTQSNKMLLSFDPNIRPSLIEDRKLYMERFETLCRISTIVKLSDEDLLWLYPDRNSNDALKILGKLGPSIIALTVGSKGAVILNKNHKALVPIIKQTVSDTIGAGDTFHGALLDYLCKNDWLSRGTLDNLTIEELEELGSYANKAAGLNCMKPGADPPNEIEMR